MHASSVISLRPGFLASEAAAARGQRPADPVALREAAMETALEHAAADTPLLIHGESGTSRARVARAVHYLGPRRGRPFICLDCAALQGTPLESTLPGLVQLAAGGTLFLDEVASLSASGQEAVWQQAHSASAVRWIAGAEDLQARGAAAAFPSALAPWLATARIDLPARLAPATAAQRSAQNV